MFPNNILNKIISYAGEKCPEECCGFILKPGNESLIFLPCENQAEDKISNFKISGKDYIQAQMKGEIKCIIHSHNNSPHVSEADQIEQQKHNIPFGIVFLSNGGYSSIIFFGDTLPIQDLLGRPFIHGILDCFGLIRSYYKKELNITLTNYPRENEWWNTDNNLLEGNMENEGFYKIDIKDIKLHDVVLFKIRGKNPNHSAIYLGNDLMLHHLYGQLSRREPIGRYRRFISSIWRHI